MNFNVEIGFNLGFIVGFMFADEEQCKDAGLNWGFSLQLGILSVNMLSYNPDAFEDVEEE